MHLMQRIMQITLPHLFQMLGLNLATAPMHGSSKRCWQTHHSSGVRRTCKGVEPPNEKITCMGLTLHCHCGAGLDTLAREKQKKQTEYIKVKGGSFDRLHTHYRRWIQAIEIQENSSGSRRDSVHANMSCYISTRMIGGKT